MTKEIYKLSTEILAYSGLTFYLIGVIIIFIRKDGELIQDNRYLFYPLIYIFLMGLLSIYFFFFN